MGTDENRKRGAATVRAFVLGMLLSGLFAWLTVLMDNGPTLGWNYRNLSGSLLPVLPHVALLLAGLLVNPLVRRLHVVRPFAKAELLLIFVMTVVSSGVASWGLSGPLVPLIAGYANREWNTEQSQWDATVAPFLDERYFILEPGSRDVARRLREAHLLHEEARMRQRSARDLLLAREELVQVERCLEELEAIEDPVLRKERHDAVHWPHQQARQLVERTESEWLRMGGGLDPLEVVETYPALIRERRRKRDEHRAELHALNEANYEAAALYRRGLPGDQRAVPGVFYSPGEGWGSYRARIRRLRTGRVSRRELERIDGLLAESIEQGTAPPSEWGAQVLGAAGMLEAISDIPALARLYDERAAELADLETALADQEQEGRRLRHLRRFSELHLFQMYTDLITESDRAATRLQTQVDRRRSELENRIQPLLAVRERVRGTQAALIELAAEADRAGPAELPELRGRLRQAIATYRGFDASTRRFWLGDVPWGLWLHPVLSWFALIFLAYLVFMTFNTLIFRQWAHHEKLIYPLAELATLLADHAEEGPRGKTMIRSGLFWTGFAISAGVLGWNHLATTNIIQNVNPISLQTLWIHHVGGALSGLASTYFCVIFAVIGVSFLVPSKISFSLWFFEVLYMGLVLVMVWLGYGANRWGLHSVGRAGIGAGAMLVFGATILWTCRRYLMCAIRPLALRGLAEDEARELRTTSFLFLGSSLALMLVLVVQWGADPFYVLLFYAILMTMTIALVRAVAEGGLLGLYSFATPFTIMKYFFGMTGGWTAPALVAPLLVFNGIVFGGFRAFIAPMMATALKVREEFRIRRLHFHLSVWAGILVAAVVSVATLLVLSYQFGADNLGEWLNTGTPRGLLGGVKGWIENTAPPRIEDRRWLLVGMVLMGGLLLGRRRFFGIPHPLGLLMIMNRNMYGFWGSILIGWLFKSMISKYCSHEQYVSIRRLFVGLIFGHLMAVLFGWESLRFHWG